jgi:hypothetical protein
MLGSILLSLALGWLANVDGTDCPCQVAQATYVVGCSDCPKACSDSACKACCNEACEACCDDCCLTGEMMCGGEPVDMGPAPRQTVVLQLRIVETKENLAGQAAFPVFMKPEEVRSCLANIQANPNTVVVSSPTLLLCSGQTGQVTVSTATPALVCPDGKCEAQVGRLVNGYSFTAEPCVSADGRFVRLELRGSATICPTGKLEQTENVQVLQAVLADGMTIVMPGSKCCSEGVSSPACCHAEGQPQKHVVIMATVHLSGNDCHTVTEQINCTRDCCSHSTAPACCDDCQKCDTVESNLAKLQRAAELYKLAEQYERLNQLDVAGKILTNIQEMCPGSRIASEANHHCHGELRMKELMAQNENLRRLELEWERRIHEMESIWSADMPRHLTAERVNGGLEESDAPSSCSKLDGVLCSYRKACSEGNKDRARQLAIEALAMDPTCFAK